MGFGDIRREVEPYMDISRREFDSLVSIASEEGPNSNAGKQLNRYLVKGMSRKIQKEGFVNAPAFDQIYSVVSLAPFIDSEEEPHYVAKTLKENIESRNITPYIVDSLVEYEKGVNPQNIPDAEKGQLAGKLLVATSLFHPFLERRASRKGAPSPGFYEEMDKFFLRSIGRDDVADNHENWKWFLPEQFLVGEN